MQNVGSNDQAKKANGQVESSNWGSPADKHKFESKLDAAEVKFEAEKVKSKSYSYTSSSNNDGHDYKTQKKVLVWKEGE